jgi:lipoyl(octanoyl) transferase
MIVKVLGPVAYDVAFDAMRAFTAARDEHTDDELWLCEHPPIFTQGIAGNDEHVLDPGQIEVVRTDRGGQVTYHGPGQVVAYPLVDLRRLGIYVKEYVFRLEQALIKTLETYGVTGHRVRGEPGVYVRLDAMELAPYERIHPCGHAGLKTIDLSTIGVRASWDEVASTLGAKLAAYLSPR